MLSKSTIQDARFYVYSSSFLDKLIGTGPVNWPALAITRFLLAFVVVASHLITYTSDPGPLKWINYFNAFNAILGFLLISGLSIGKSISKDKNGYFSRRIQRIYPVYLASMVLHYLIMPRDITVFFLITLVVNLLFLNQLVTNTSFVGPAWTLALEVWLYSLAPLLVKLSYRTLLIITSLSFLSYCLYTCGRSLFDWPYYSGTQYGLNLLLLSFIWILGFMLARFNTKAKHISIIVGFVFLVLFILNFSISLVYNFRHHQMSYFLTERMIHYVYEIICLIFIYYVVIGNHNLPDLSLPVKKIFNFLGNISYPLYLTHSSVLDLCKKLSIANWGLLVISCMIVASAIYLLFDFYSKKRAI